MLTRELPDRVPYRLEGGGRLSRPLSFAPFFSLFVLRNLFKKSNSPLKSPMLLKQDKDVFFIGLPGIRVLLQRKSFHFLLVQ